MFDFLSYRTIAEADAELILKWRTAPHVAPYMLSKVDWDLCQQRLWIRECNARNDFFHRIIRINQIDVGYCSITVFDSINMVGQLGVYIGDLDVPRALSMYNFLGTQNHAFYTVGVKSIKNRIKGDNNRTLKMQTFNGYIEISQNSAQGQGRSSEPSLKEFELTKERWHEFRRKFGYFRDWDGLGTDCG